METLYTYVGNACYGALAVVALFGAYCIFVVMRRLAVIRFNSEDEQETFLQSVEEPLAMGNFEAVLQACEGDDRALPQLVTIGVENREFGFKQVQKLLGDRLRRDILADLERRTSWIVTCIKTAPMLGLYGTVLGMMGAFKKLAGGDAVEPSVLAGDISLALITTAIGLTIAIPLTMFLNGINIRIRTMEELMGEGLNRFAAALKAVIS